MNHTPGPWVVDEGTDCIDNMIDCLQQNDWIAVGVTDEDGYEASIAYCHPINAPLIAAAPDMESILRRLAEKALRISEPPWVMLRIEDRHELRKLAMEAGDVLSKARGMR